MYWRECFRNGNQKTGQRCLEAHAFCECPKCKSRYAYARDPRNMVCVTIADESMIEVAEKFIESWRCKDGNTRLPVEYHSF